MRKNNRPMVETILKRMRWVQKLTGAQAIGLAGQLGPIFEKRHGIPMEPPFYSSTYGNIFSIQNAVSHLVSNSQRHPWQVSVSIIGGGLLAEDLLEHLTVDGYNPSVVDVRYTRKGDVKLADEHQAAQQLADADIVINLLPRGKDFLDCRLHHQIPETATIIDFSRPPIGKNTIPQKVVMGNRVMSSNIHFFMRLPGGWKKHELPACSMPSLLASLNGLPILNLEEFRKAARQFRFQTALAGAPLPPYQKAWQKIRTLAADHPVTVRLLPLLGRSR